MISLIIIWAVVIGLIAIDALLKRMYSKTSTESIKRRLRIRRLHDFMWIGFNATMFVFVREYTILSILLLILIVLHCLLMFRPLGDKL